MDKNSVIGLILIAVLLVAYSLYNQPSQDEIEAQRRMQDSVAAAQAQQQAETQAASGLPTDTLAAPISSADSASAAARTSELQAKYGVFAKAAEGEERQTVVETDKYRLTFSNKGGVPVKAVLKEYTSFQGEPLVLFDENTASMGYAFTYPSLGNLRTDDFYFSTRGGETELDGEESEQLIYTLDLGGGRKIENIYTIKAGTYDIGYESRFFDLDGVVTAPKLVWELSAHHVEKSVDAERRNSTIFYKEVDEGRDYLSESGDDEEIIDDNRLRWVAFKMNFFSTILIADKPLEPGAALSSHPFEESVDSLTQFYRAELPVDIVGGTAISGRLFMGPNDYKVLNAYGYELDKVINLGWGIFGWVNKFVVIPIFDLLESTGLSYGIIILILTVVIKLVLSPLTLKNYVSSAKMRVLKPEIEEINEKYKDADPMKKQQATMDLYRKTGVNPFAGCIPMLIQLPILYAMFRFFPSSIQLRHEPFLWADDLSAYDSIAQLPFHIPAYGDHVSLFTLLMAASTLVYTVYNSNQMPTQSQPGMPNMKIIMYIFPFMMIFFFNSFASGLSYYYLLANLFSIGQMIVIKKFFIDEDKIREKIHENKKKRAKKGKSKFQRRLEEMAKERGVKTK